VRTPRREVTGAARRDGVESFHEHVSARARTHARTFFYEYTLIIDASHATASFIK